jgi:transposase
LPISKGYDADELVKWIQQTEAWVVIPPMSNRTVLRDYHNVLYNEFNRVERMCGYLKYFRLTATRYAKTALLPVDHPVRSFSYFWIK